MDIQKLLTGDKDAKAEFLSLSYDERTTTLGDYLKGVAATRHFTPAEINGMAWPIWQVNDPAAKVLDEDGKVAAEDNSLKVLRAFVSSCSDQFLSADGTPDYDASQKNQILVIENLAMCRRMLVGTLHGMPEPYSWHGLCLTNIEEAKLALERSDLSDGATKVAVGTVYGYFHPELETFYGEMLANWQPEVAPTPENLQKAQQIIGLLGKCKPMDESVCKAS